MKNKSFDFKLDKFDSEVFDLKTAKILELSSEGVNEIIDEFSDNKIVYATIRVDSNNLNLIHALEGSGFILVDGLVTLSIDLSLINFDLAKEIREANREDLPKLKKLTTNLFLNTRITNDPIVKDKANNYYTKWVENSLSGEAADSVLVWEEENEILGYITLQRKGVKGQIPLIGVSAQARGKGIAKRLLDASFSKFRDWNIKEINIETQMGNIAALRVYQKVGFKIVSSSLTFRWAQ